MKYGKGKKSLLEENDTDPKSNIPIVDDEDECKELQSWLKYHADPFPDVISKWQLTHHFRRRMLQCDGATIDEIFEAWPLLKTVKADVLVNCLICVFFNYFTNCCFVSD